MEKLEIDGMPIRYVGDEEWQKFYFSLPDLCRGFEGEAKDLISNWLRTRSTLNFMAEWERKYNPGFRVVEFDNLMRYAGDNTFSMSVTKWVENIAGKCIYLKKGRGGGSYAHILVTLHFANWLSAKFYLQFTQSYFGLLEDKFGKDAIENQVKRMWARLNYPLHTGAVKLLVSSKADKEVERRQYADEGDMLNLLVFHETANEWRLRYPDRAGNMRDYATTLQLHVLANLENLNQFLIKHGLDQEERFQVLQNEAGHQFDLLAKYVDYRK